MTNIEQIKKHFLKELSETIYEIYNGELTLDISVVGVEANHDATVVTCFFDFVNNKDEQISFLEENKSLIKTELAHKSNFKKFPELVFDYDAQKFFDLYDAKQEAPVAPVKKVVEEEVESETDSNTDTPEENETSAN